MFKSLSPVSVFLSVVLSLSLTFGLFAHSQIETAKVDTIKGATHQLTGQLSSMWGVGDASCTAVAIQPNVMLTAAHCDLDAMKIDGVDAKVLKKDEKKDLMLVYAQVGGGYVPVAEYGTLKNGDEIVTYGYPLGMLVGFVPVFTYGEVQGYIKGEKKYDTEQFTGYVMSILPIAGGNSGGGIFKRINGQWRVVSIVSHGVEHLSISPSLEMVREFVNSPNGVSTLGIRG